MNDIAIFSELNLSSTTYHDARGSVQILYETDQYVLKRSRSRSGVFRGLHWQRPPALQEKFIRVIEGEIVDFVARPEDEAELILAKRVTPETGWIHIGGELAHGFYACQETLFEYFCIGAYDEKREECFSVNDLVADFLSVGLPTVSSKDRQGKSFGRSVEWYKEI